MEISFSPEMEAKLAESAAKQARKPEQFVQDVVAQYLEEEALARGEYLTHEQVSERLCRFL